ncbi:MAG: hypothetical protein D6753_17485, partial [Planctomycetota bacterium]
VPGLPEGFVVAAEKRDRLAGLYTLDDDGRLRQVGSEAVTAGFLRFTADYCTGPTALASGGAGLVAPIGDYLRFLQMLLGEGRLDETRVLRAETVRLMTQNHIGDLRVPFPGHGDGFGFGFGVLTDRGKNEDVASVGSYSWGGIFNTYFWVDPQQQLIGVLMTQLFPYDHLSLREDFKQLAYAAIDDSGFSTTYWYQPGLEHGNPYENPRQVRVNAPEAVVHPQWSERSETHSSGLANIRVDEKLRRVRRADLVMEIWGGHPGTANKRVWTNGRRRLDLPEVGTADGHCTHQYPAFNLRPTDLVSGFNAMQFACDSGTASWGHFIVDNVGVSVGLLRNDERLESAGLSDFVAQVVADPVADGEGFQLRIDVPQELAEQIERVDYQGRYFGYDENGNGYRTDWHGMSKHRRPYGIIGSSAQWPYRVTWDTSMLPTQSRVAVRAVVHFRQPASIAYHTAPADDLAIRRAGNDAVRLVYADELPRPFWSRAGRRVTCTIDIDVPVERITRAELHVVSWTGGAGDVRDYFQLNGHALSVAEGKGHEVVYTRLPVDPRMLKQGKNEIELLSDTAHHGIEIMRPGPALALRIAPAPVQLGEGSAPGAPEIDCYVVRTPTATYYLDKVGGGLASIVDRQGRDWLSFRPEPGSGPRGEYRGFPNAVFQSPGSYFHPRNAGTDPCVATIEEVTDERIRIGVASSDGNWMGRFTFTPAACIFTMLRKPENKKYWVLYEGTPGGQLDADDWWMSSGMARKQPIATPADQDLPEPEWMAFGDRGADRMIVLGHYRDDAYPDSYYAMDGAMTVFGFGRRQMSRFLDSTPDSFSIAVVDGQTARHAAEHIAMVQRTVERERAASGEATGTARQSDHRAALKRFERYAMTTAGDPENGKRLFFNDLRFRCQVCHRVAGEGGQVGPDLTSIGGKFDRPHLIESVLEPSKQIVEGYRTQVVLTEDGQVFVGIPRSDSGDALVLRTAEGNDVRIDREEIAEQRMAAISLMPVGLVDYIQPTEFADLIAYLETLRTGPAKMGAGVAGPVALPEGFVIETVATGLTGATAMEIAPDGRVFICEQTGALRVVENGTLVEHPVVELPVECYWERGLIGVTVHPDFPTTPDVFVVYVAGQPYPHHRISCIRLEGNRGVPESERILLQGDDQRQFGGNVPAGHQGGAIHFGPDGKLYVGIGEQTAGTPAQRLDALQGKILCLNADGSIPPDNPFVGQTQGKYRAIWAIGCRNPFTFAIRRTDGLMLINDVGGKYEEINRGMPGANYGWPIVEHGPTDAEGIVGPIYWYPQSSINGGDFARDNLPGSWRGKYFFADFVQGWIRALDPDNPGEAATFATGLRRPVDLRFSPSGDLYVLLRNAWVVDDKFEPRTGSLLRIRYQPRDGS